MAILPGRNAAGAGSFRRLHPTGSLPWGLVYLSTTAAEVESLGATPTGGDGHWTRLLGKERRAGVAALVAAGLEGGVQVTAREASVLDRVVHSGQSADLDGLWPFLERADAVAWGRSRNGRRALIWRAGGRRWCRPKEGA